MENASKALIIAGAILVSIILISLGIMVLNSSGEMTGRMDEEMQSSSISAFNSKFTQYSGSQKGSVIKQLMGTVDSSNASSDHQVSVSWGSYNTTDDIASNIKQTKSYTVKVVTAKSDGEADGAVKGYVYKIEITG